jgi:hypothetical protein
VTSQKDIDEVIGALTETPQDIVVVVLVDYLEDVTYTKEFTREMMSLVTGEFIDSLLDRHMSFYGDRMLPSKAKVVRRFTSVDGVNFKPNA